MRAVLTLFPAMIACGCSALPAIDTLETRHATVIDPASGTVTPDRCIRISGDTITGVFDCAPALDIPSIDVRDRRVIPGLWDMHVHAIWHEDVYETFFEEFIRFGVVGVRAGVLRGWRTRRQKDRRPRRTELDMPGILDAARVDSMPEIVIILRSDPLQDIENRRDIESVVISGTLVLPMQRGHRAIVTER